MKRTFARIKHEYNNAFDRLIVESDNKRLATKLSDFMTRPAYAGTSLEQKDMYSANGCVRCRYWKKGPFFEGCTVTDMGLCPRRYE